MASCSNVFFAILMLLAILAISEITTVKGDLCEKMSKTWSGKCLDSKKCDKKCIDWEGAEHGACHKREGGHLCFCYFECGPKDKNTPPGKQPAPPSGGQPAIPPGQPVPPKGGKGAGGGDGGGNGGGQPAPPGRGAGGGKPAPPSGDQPTPPPAGCQNVYVDKLIAEALARYKSQLNKM